MIQAVIFDMDGLLVDSERISVAMNCKAGEMLGYPITPDLVKQVFGANHARKMAIYRAAIPNFSPEKFDEVYPDLFMNALTSERLRMKKGAKSLLNHLKTRGIAVAVASSSSPERIAICLGKTRLTRYFDTIISGAMIEHSKPAPDIFLLAAKRLGVPPQMCLVLEDAPNGLMAGRAAGMRTVMIPDLIPFTDDLLPYADAVLHDLFAVREYIAKVNGEGTTGWRGTTFS